MLNKRDLQVIDFVKTFNVATTSQLTEMFFPSSRYAQARLRQLVEYKELKRDRDFVCLEYLYYIKKPSKRILKHALKVADFYVKFSKLVEIEEFATEVCLENIRVDGLAGYKHNNKNHLAFVEIQFNNNKFDIAKYKRFYNSNKWKNYFPVFPKLIVVSNQYIDPIKDIEVIQIKEDLSDINSIY